MKLTDDKIKRELAEFLRFQGELGLWGMKINPAAKKAATIAAVPQEPAQPAPSATVAPAQQPVAAPASQQSVFASNNWDGEKGSADEITAAMDALKNEIGDCKRCRLHNGRNKIVFGSGNPATRIVFVGEAPGHDEDISGVAFVGRAGKLLDKIIGAMGLSRETCFICNVVKCRPPDNRNPLADEQTVCGEFLKKQLEIIKPEMIVALGAVAANFLMQTQRPIGRMRSRFWLYKGAKLMPTYHPSYLLRSPQVGKPKVWDDMQMVMKEMNLEDPRKK